jgi:hypothetical protein
MKSLLLASFWLTIGFLSQAGALAQEDPANAAVTPTPTPTPTPATTTTPAHPTTATPTPSSKSPFDALTEKLKKVEGMWKLYYKEQQLLVEISSSQLGQNYMVNTSIARGISRGAVLGGI